MRIVSTRALAAALLLLGVAAVACTLLRPAPSRLPPDRAHPVLYVAQGDSTVAGVGASAPAQNYASRLHERRRSAYPGARLVNLGVSGATAAELLAAQLREAVTLSPDLVTLSIGPNDITSGRAVEQYEQDLKFILRALTRETRAVVVLNLIPDLTVTPRFRGRAIAASMSARVSAFNRALSRQGQRYGAEVVDLYGPSQREIPEHPEFVAGDGYHPSDQGYARWAELMWQGIEARTPR
ncbi:MAG: SGNH/GDSL hydrolase family protein [candidate division NC10 bacterium]